MGCYNYKLWKKEIGHVSSPVSLDRIGSTHSRTGLFVSFSIRVYAMRASMFIQYTCLLLIVYQSDWIGLETTTAIPKL